MTVNRGYLGCVSLYRGLIRGHGLVCSSNAGSGSLWPGKSYPVTCSITDYSNKGLLNTLKPVLFYSCRRNIPCGDFREETQRKPLPKIAKNRAELEFGQVIASQNYVLCVDRGMANRDKNPQNDRLLPPQHRAGCRVSSSSKSGWSL